MGSAALLCSRRVVPKKESNVRSFTQALRRCSNCGMHIKRTAQKCPWCNQIPDWVADVAQSKAAMDEPNVHQRLQPYEVRRNVQVSEPMDLGDLPDSDDMLGTSGHPEQADEQLKVPGPPQVAIWIALGGAIAVIAGSFGPWVSMFAIFAFLSVGGMETNPGKITAALGLAAGILILFRAAGNAALWTSILAFLALNAAWMVGAYYWNDISSALGEAEEEEFAGLVRIGWGLQAITLGGAIGAISLIVHWIRGEQSA